MSNACTFFEGKAYLWCRFKSYILTNIGVWLINRDLSFILFYQLRTQALASLHSGLQNNQGIPVSDTSNWIGMEVIFLNLLLGVSFSWSAVTE